MKKVSKSLRAVSLILALTLALVIFAGCSQTGGTGSGTSDSGGAASGEPVEIIWFQELRGIEPDSNRIIQEIEKELNIKLNFVSAPGDSEAQQQKLNLMVSTGEALDLVTFLDSIKALHLQWVKDDILYDFDQFAGDYPTVGSVIDADIYNYLKIDGKTYFQPMPLKAGNRGYIIRKDWLDKLNLDIPTNLEEYYEVLTAFVTQDPDGNGQDDTYGFFVSEPYGANSFGYIARSFANCGAWGGDWVELPDGTITQFVASDYAKEAFRFIKKCYDEGLFNKGFVNEKDAEGKLDDLMVQGKLGIMDVTSVTSLLQRFEDAGVEADLVYLPPLNKADGSKGSLPHSGGSWGYHLIPKTSTNPEKVMELLEWSMTEHGRELTMYGIEGIHFSGSEVKDGVKVYEINAEEMAKDWNVTDYGYNLPISWGGFNYDGGYIPIAENDYNYTEAYPKQEIWKDQFSFGTAFDLLPMWNAEYAQTFPLQATIDESVIVDQKLVDIEIQGRTKAIVDPADQFDANWDAMVEEWMAAGGAELIERGNTAWKALGN
ncbi:MAG: hypothetical protein ACK5LX_04365 [Oscillospiraceae bacterium]